MYTEKRRTGRINILFFATIWVFFSLNARYIRVPNADLIRWGMIVVLIIDGIRRASVKFPSFLFVFTLAVAPSFIHSYNQEMSVTKFLSFLFLAIGFFSYFNSMPTKDSMENLIESCMWVILIFEILSVVCMATGVGFDDVHIRAIGITTNANTLGIYANLALLSAFYFYQNRNKKIFLIIMLLSILTAIMCGSRTAFISLVLNILVIFYIRYKGSSTYFFVGLGLVIVAYLIVSGVIHITAVDRLLAVDDGSGNLGISRTNYWLAGIRVWKQYPYFGCGYVVSAFLNTADPGNPFHNSYLSILAETGIWGASLILFGTGKRLLHFFTVAFYDIRRNMTTIFVIVSMMMIELLLAAYSESFLFAVGSTEGCMFWLLFFWSIIYCENYDYWLQYENELYVE